MRLLPLDDLRLQSPEPPEVLARRLDALITRGWLVPGVTTPFRGDFDGRAFKIVPVASRFRRNSFRPVLTGAVLAAPGGSELRARLRPQLPVMIFMLAWAGMPLALAVGLAWQVVLALLSPGAHGPAELRDPLVTLAFTLLFLLAGWLIVSTGFWPDAGKARAALAEGLRPRPGDRFGHGAAGAHGPHGAPGHAAPPPPFPPGRG